MTESQKQLLEKKLWDIANELRWKMSADEFRDYILGFIFYKYLSEKIQLKANFLMSEWWLDLKYENLDLEKDLEIIKVVEISAIRELWYFLKPNELFERIAKKWLNKSENENNNFILDDLQKILKNIENSTLWTDSEDDFNNLFEDLDLTSSKLWNTALSKNNLVSKILWHLQEIDF